MEKLELDFYYGRESEQFTFYRLPKALITDERFKGVSNNAKLLYGLMLDRMSLSKKRGWLDDDNKVIEHVQNVERRCGQRSGDRRRKTHYKKEPHGKAQRF